MSILKFSNVMKLNETTERNVNRCEIIRKTFDSDQKHTSNMNYLNTAFSDMDALNVEEPNDGNVSIILPSEEPITQHYSKLTTARLTIWPFCRLHFIPRAKLLF